MYGVNVAKGREFASYEELRSLEHIRRRRRNVPEGAIDWRVYVFQLLGGDPSLKGPQLSRKVAERASELHALGYAGSRTVDRYLAEWRDQLTEQQRREYMLVRWPETFEAGILPWEAAHSFLEALRWLHAQGLRRPNVRFARWLWQVTQSIPRCSLDDRIHVAGRLASWEAKGELASVRRAFELALAYATQTNAFDYDALPRLQFMSDSPDLAEIIRSMPATDIDVDLARLVESDEQEEHP